MSAVCAFPYFGGKSAASNSGTNAWIRGILPSPHGKQQYCEPFFGMGGVLLARQPAGNEYVSDLNSHIANLWLVIRDNPDELIRLLTYTERSECQYQASVDFLAAEPDFELGSVEHAWRYALVLWLGVMPGTSRMFRTQSHVSTGTRHPADVVASVVGRMRNVRVYQRDALDFIEWFCGVGKAQRVIYCDPPYRESGGDLYAVSELDGLGELLAGITPERALVAVSSYGQDYAALENRGWQRHEKRVQKTGDVRSAEAVEVLWTNYETQPQLF